MSPLVVSIGLVIAIGIAGTVLPVLPGLWLIWGTCVVFGLIDGFGVAGWIAMTVITALAAAGTLAGVVMPQRTATAGGLTLRDQLVAVAFAVVGFFVIPVVGAIAGFVAGVFVVALVRTRDAAGAIRSTWASVKSFGLVAVLQFGTGILMALAWVAWVIA